jgi:ribosomal protein S18 acetylase RimI-like enzyme
LKIAAARRRQRLVGRPASVENPAMGEFEVRRARPDELEAAVGVWERARWDAQQPRLKERMKYAHEDSLRHFRDVVMRNHEVWLAVEDDAIVGMLAFGEHAIDQLHVEPRCQGRGIGTALLDRAKARSPRGLTLSTHQGNERARAFYERRGFRAVQLGVSPPPEGEPDVKYAWDPREGG